MGIGGITSSRGEIADSVDPTEAPADYQDVIVSYPNNAPLLRIYYKDPYGQDNGKPPATKSLALKLSKFYLVKMVDVKNSVSLYEYNGLRVDPSGSSPVKLDVWETNPQGKPIKLITKITINGIGIQIIAGNNAVFEFLDGTIIDDLVTMAADEGSVKIHVEPVVPNVIQW